MQNASLNGLEETDDSVLILAMIYEIIILTTIIKFIEDKMIGESTKYGGNETKFLQVLYKSCKVLYQTL